MQTYDILIRVSMAVAIGGLIGYERGMRRRPAGFRTHILVCLGAAVVSMIQILVSEQTVDLLLSNMQLAEAIKVDNGRIVAQVVTGVGFLGAGTIILHKGTVKGLTTASTIWVVACIGIGIGYGFYKLSAISGLATFLVNFLFKNFERNISDRRYGVYVHIAYTKDKHNKHLEEIISYIKSKYVNIRDIQFEPSNMDNVSKVKLTLYSPRLKSWDRLLADLTKKSYIVSLNIDK